MNVEICLTVISDKDKLVITGSLNMLKYFLITFMSREVYQEPQTISLNKPTPGMKFNLGNNSKK